MEPQDNPDVEPSLEEWRLAAMQRAGVKAARAEAEQRRAEAGPEAKPSATPGAPPQPSSAPRPVPTPASGPAPTATPATPGPSVPPRVPMTPPEPPARPALTVRAPEAAATIPPEPASPSVPRVPEPPASVTPGPVYQLDAPSSPAGRDPHAGEPLHLPGREEVERLARAVRMGAVPSVLSVPIHEESTHSMDFGPHPTAAEFSESMVLGRMRSGAQSGWRRAVNMLIGGLVTLPPGRAEHRRNQYLARVRTPIDGTRRIVVMSRKGGVGKTTITVGVGMTFAEARGDRVVAVDANPDAGNLARRISGECQRTITDLLADSTRVRSFATMRGYTSQCIESRLEVLASDDDARIAQALDRNAYEQVVSLLDHYYNLILLDTGTGILDSANQGLIAQADQLVLVVRPALDGARAGAQTLDWLEEHGHSDLVASAVVAVNGVDRDTDPIVTFSRQHFAQRCSHVSTIPWDRALEAGGRMKLSSLHRRTREAFVDVAAALADQFSEPTRGQRAGKVPPQLPDQLHDEDISDDIPAFLQ